MENASGRNCCIEEYGFDESETTLEILVSLYEKILLDADSVHNIERHKAEYASEKVNKGFSGLIAYLR
jgi:predicted HTH domain antitoxin